MTDDTASVSMAEMQRLVSNWIAAYVVSPENPDSVHSVGIARAIKQRLLAGEADARRLERYGQHDMDCRAHPLYPHSGSLNDACQCGFAAPPSEDAGT